MSKSKHVQIWLFSLLIAVFLVSCNMPRGEQANQQATAEMQTIVAQTLTAQAQTDQPAPTTAPPTATAEETPAPSVTPTETQAPTATFTPTSTAIPCNRAEFVKDVTIPDGTDFNPGDTFVKTWRLKNTGSCEWTSGYKIIFSSGDQMGGPDAAQLTSGIVSPGGTVDVSVDLTAPDDPGTYRGNWKLRDPNDQVFGIQGTGEFWVEIEVLPPTDTPVAKPDLKITQIELAPASPTKENPVDVKVTVYNQGEAASGAFTVLWYPGENYTSPACSWNLTSLVATGGRVLSCTYSGYPSPYPSGINTLAIADSDNDVDESDESNNRLLMEVIVQSP